MRHGPAVYEGFLFYAFHVITSFNGTTPFDHCHRRPATCPREAELLQALKNPPPYTNKRYCEGRKFIHLRGSTLLGLRSCTDFPHFSHSAFENTKENHFPNALLHYDGYAVSVPDWGPSGMVFDHTFRLRTLSSTGFQQFILRNHVGSHNQTLPSSRIYMPFRICTLLCCFGRLYSSLHRFEILKKMKWQFLRSTCLRFAAQPVRLRKIE